jgi:hypothetical protein
VADGIINLCTDPAKPKPEAAMKKRSLVVRVVPGAPFPAAAGAHDGLLARNRTGHP